MASCHFIGLISASHARHVGYGSTQFMWLSIAASLLPCLALDRDGSDMGRWIVMGFVAAFRQTATHCRTATCHRRSLSSPSSSRRRWVSGSAAAAADGFRQPDPPGARLARISPSFGWVFGAIAGSTFQRRPLIVDLPTVDGGGAAICPRAVLLAARTAMAAPRHRRTSLGNNPPHHRCSPDLPCSALQTLSSVAWVSDLAGSHGCRLREGDGGAPKFDAPVVHRNLVHLH
ncbi:hypothetical protein ACLOJK_007175 [Asimina triloba]